jgi:hypothetical protein
LFLGVNHGLLRRKIKVTSKATEIKFLRGFKRCALCDQIQNMYIKHELNISSVTDNIIYNKDNWREQKGKQAPSSVMSSSLQHLVHTLL